MRLCLVAIGAALTVSACVSSNEPPVVIAKTVAILAPAEARKTCDAPAALPDRGLSARETVTQWSQDRTALRICETRRKAAVKAIDAANAPETVK